MSFVRYNPEDSVISSETVVRGLFSGDNNSLTVYFTQSGFTEYYMDIYNADASLSSSAVQFSIQYGNLYGSGSKVINTNVPNGGYTPSRVVYGEYRNLVYGTETQNFSFDNTAVSASQIFVLNYARARYKESLQPGTLNLVLSGSAGVIKLIDDSSTTNLTRYIGENEVYYVISGSDNVPYAPATASYYGMMFPDLNIIVLNATSGSATSLLPWITGSTANLNQTTSSVANNQLKLYNALSASAAAGYSMTLQSNETVSSRYFFTRVKNSEFNYTTNPSIIDANGNLLYTTLINNPQTYITSVGMYNDNNELLAVAKLSQPLTKDFTKEALIRIKLDY